MTSEAAQLESINVAKGEAQATLLRADATAAALERVGKAISAGGGDSAVTLRVAEKWVEAFGKLAKEGTTLVVPADVGNPSAAIAKVSETVLFDFYANSLL